MSGWTAPSAPFPGSSWRPLSDRSVRLGLTLVLGVALATRVWGVRYGLPYFVHPDESIVVPIAVQFLTGDLNPHFFNWPTLYMYVLAGLYTVYGAVLQATEGVSAVTAFTRDPAPFYVIGRLMSSLLGTITVGLTYLLGTRLFGADVGLAASLFLAMNLQHVVDSHFATTDAAVTCMLMAALLATARYWHRGEARDALLAGLLGGVAASIKYNGGLIGAAFVVAHTLRHRAAGTPWWAALRERVLPLWIGGAVVGFLAGTPFAALAAREFMRGLFGEVQAIGTVQFGNEGDPPGLLFHLLHSLPQAMGIPLLLCAGAGLAVILWHRRPSHLLFLAFPLPYLAIISSWDSRFERYAVPLLPFASVLSAVGLAALASRWPSRRGLVFAIAVALAVIPTSARVLYYELLLARPDSRELAGLWLERSLPPGTRVAMEPYSPPVTWRDQAGDSHLVTSPPLVSPMYGIAQKLPAHRPRAAWATGLRVSSLPAYDLDTLRARGIDYVVLSSFMYKRFTESCDRFPMHCRFYRDLDARATLVYVVRPVPEDWRLWVGDIYAPVSQVFGRARPGPIIKVYRLRGEG